MPSEAASLVGLAPKLEAMDHTRGRTAPLFGPSAFKEWHHFVVFAGDVELLVNFSCCERVPRVAGAQAEQPRIVLLVRRGGWDGDILEYDLASSRIDRGRIRFELAGNLLELRDGRYRLRVRATQPDLQLDLQLEPKTAPVFVPSTPMHDGPPLHWVAVPRLDAFGTLRIGDEERRLHAAPAYHDHNWGHFLWGHDLSWEWGFVLPDDADQAWALVFVRLTDRARTTALDHKLLLWRDGELVASFREGEIRTTISPQAFRPDRLFQVPRVMGLLHADRLPDLPQRFAMDAARGGDVVRVDSFPYDLAQVLIPSETDLGVTIFNEVSSMVRVEGRLRGRDFAFEGRSMMELIRHA